MRTILLIIFFLNSFSFYGQLPSAKAMFLNSNVYRTRVDLTAVRLINKNLTTISYDNYIISVSELGHLDYKIINEDENGYVIIRVLPKVKLDTDTKIVSYTEEEQFKSDVDNAYNYYFAVKKDDFKPLSKTLLSTKFVGIPLVHPIKLRPSKGIEGWNLNGEFTLSYNFGFRFKISKNPFAQNFISIIPYGFGVGEAKYFKENLDGTLTDKKDSFAVTYYQSGILVTLQKVNFGVFTGFDAMIDKQNDWFYQGKPWISFGLGYKFKMD